MAFIADVFDALLVDNEGEVFATTTLQSADIEIAVKENEVRGGKGNSLLAVIHSDRDINVKMTDAEFKYEWMARQLGQTIVTGAGKAYAMPKYYTATGESDVSITLDETPVIGTLAIYKDGKFIPASQYSLSDKAVTFTSGVVSGDEIEVRTYQFATSAETQTLAIDNKVFAKGCKLILETIEIDDEEQPTYKVQYVFEKAVPTGNFSVKTAAERTAQAQEFNLRVLKPAGDNVVGSVVRIPIQ